MRTSPSPGVSRMGVAPVMRTVTVPSTGTGGPGPHSLDLGLDRAPPPGWPSDGHLARQPFSGSARVPAGREK